MGIDEIIKLSDPEGFLTNKERISRMTKIWEVARSIKTRPVQSPVDEWKLSNEIGAVIQASLESEENGYQAAEHVLKLIRPYLSKQQSPVVDEDAFSYALVFNQCSTYSDSETAFREFVGRYLWCISNRGER